MAVGSNIYLWYSACKYIFNCIDWCKVWNSIHMTFSLHANGWITWSVGRIILPAYDCKLFQLLIKSARHSWPWSILAIMFRSFNILAPKDFLIIWLPNLLILSVPDKGYSRSASYVLNLLDLRFWFYRRVYYFWWSNIRHRENYLPRRQCCSTDMAYYIFY